MIGSKQGHASAFVITSILGDLGRPAARSRIAINSPRRAAWLSPRFSPGVITTSPISERMSSKPTLVRANSRDCKIGALIDEGFEPACEQIKRRAGFTSLGTVYSYVEVILGTGRRTAGGDTGRYRTGR